MLRRATVTITAKCLLATLLLAFAVLSTGVSMPCLAGMAMEPVAIAQPEPKSDSCCPTKTPDPVKAQEPEPNKCCCIDNLGKTIAEFNVGKFVQPSIDFPILLAPPVEFEFVQAAPQVQQIRWPEVHGPPGNERSTDSPRAPPVA